MTNKSNARVIYINNREEAYREIVTIGADEQGAKLMAAKAVQRVLKLKDIPVKSANIIKQEMLSKGGEAAVNRGTIDYSVATTDIILMGTERQLQLLCNKLKAQPFGLKRVAADIIETLGNITKYNDKHIITCGNLKLELGYRTLIMGILNITPDSFSDGGKYNQVDKAVARAEQMIAEGADIIDVGAESTRPNSDPVEEERELERILPIVSALSKKVSVPISVDTYKSEVARQALEAGAHIINDIWGAKREPAIAQVAAEYDAPLIVMHNQHGTDYQDLMGDICQSLRESIAICREAGVSEDKIIIDPGIGFGKDYAQNLAVMTEMEQLGSLGKPLLLGTSRKSLIGNTLNLPVAERVEGTAATVAIGIAKGADIVRVHDVKEMVRVAEMTDAMVRRK